MQVKDLKTVNEFFDFVTKEMMPLFTEPFDHYFEAAKKELDDYNAGKIDNITLRAVPENDSKVYICPTGEFPGVCIEVMYTDGEVSGYSFVLYKRDCVISPMPEIPALIYNNEFCCWFSTEEFMTLEEIDATSLDVDLTTLPLNHFGPFTISQSGEYIYSLKDSIARVTPEEFEAHRLKQNLLFLKNNLKK